jgi:hypothetical protein
MYTLEQIFDYIKMPEECAKLSLECLDRHKDTEIFIKLKEDFYKGCNVKGALYDYAEEKGEPFRMVYMAFCLYCVDRMYDIYVEKRRRKVVLWNN